MQKHIFRKYDIRGEVGVDFQIDQLCPLTNAILSFFSRKKPKLERIAIALDGREYSEEIYKIVSQAICDAGYKIYFLGVCPTPAFVYGLHHLPVQAGIMISVSCAANNYNGFELYSGTDPVWGDDIQMISTLFDQNIVREKSSSPGSIVPCPIINQYIESLWQQFSYLSQYDFSVIIDCEITTVSSMMSRLVVKMGWKKVRVLADGESLLEEMSESLKHNDHTFAVRLDGNGDCMIGIERNGSLILGDRMLALFAQDILKKDKNAKIVYDIKSSSVVHEIVDKHHGISIVSATGSPVIQGRVKQEKAKLGGELSGHYFFQDRHDGYDDGLYAFLRLLELLVKEQKSLYDLLQQLPEKYVSTEIRIPCDEQSKEQIVQKIGTALAEQKRWKISHVDGVKVVNDQGWGLFRASHTESIVSFRCEARSKKDLATMKKEFHQMLQPFIESDVLKDLF